MNARMVQGVLVGITVGVALGIGIYTFAYARGMVLKRSPRAQPGAQHQPGLPDLPQVAGGKLKARVETIQERTYKLRNVAMDALMDLIKDLKAAKGAGKSEKELATAQDFQRKAQFYLDFVEAENSTGFHAPQEAARILGESIDFSRKGQNALRDGKGAARPQAVKR
jgi:Cytochrome c552